MSTGNQCVMQTTSRWATHPPAIQTRCRTSPSRCWWMKTHRCTRCPRGTGPETWAPGRPGGSSSRPGRPPTLRRRAPRCTRSWRRWCRRRSGSTCGETLYTTRDELGAMVNHDTVEAKEAVSFEQFVVKQPQCLVPHTHLIHSRFQRLVCNIQV